MTLRIALHLHRAETAVCTVNVGCNNVGSDRSRCYFITVLQNRAFQQVTPSETFQSLSSLVLTSGTIDTTSALTAWHSVNSGSLSVIADPNPVSSALPNSLQLKIPSGQRGTVGFSNEGYWGIKVDSSWTYTTSFYFKFPSRSSFRGDLSVGLQDSAGKLLASKRVPISGTATSWTHVQTQLKPTTSAANTNNSFVVTVDGAGGQTIDFAMFSLFPPTFKNRSNGMRIDIAEVNIRVIRQNLTHILRRHWSRWVPHSSGSLAATI